jgi:hypothetical protein
VTDIHWDVLDDGRPKNKAEVKKKIPLPRECPKCTAIVASGVKVCPNCGNDLRIVSGMVERDGELVEVTAGERQSGAKKKYTMIEKAQWFSGLKFIAIEKGYKIGWAAQQYKKKFGVWPDHSFDNIPEMSPTAEVRSWVKSRMIAYAMWKKKQGVAAA